MIIHAFIHNISFCFFSTCSTPQPIQVKLHMIRGLRDKLPAGRYSVVVSLQDRLGGRLLRWSALRGQVWRDSKSTRDWACISMFCVFEYVPRILGVAFHLFICIHRSSLPPPLSPPSSPFICSISLLYLFFLSRNGVLLRFPCVTMGASPTAIYA